MKRIVGLILASGLAVTAGAAAAADQSQQNRAEWFKGLLQPGTEAPCCSISDCTRTVADWRNGQWWAMVVGEWTPIPPETVLDNTQSIDGDAYVCSTHYRKIYCFVKPDTGM